MRGRGRRRLLDHEQLFQPGQVEEIAHRLGQCSEGHAAALRGQMALGREKDPQTRAADIAELRAVHHDPRAFFNEHRSETLLEQGSRHRIEPPGE